MNIMLALVLRPADKPVPAADMTWRRRPGETGDGSLPGIDDIFELLSYRMAITQIMVLLDKTVESLFFTTAPHLTKSKWFYLRKLPINRRCIDLYNSWLFALG